MKCCCLFKVENGVRALHFVLTLGIFLLLVERPSDLRDAWVSKSVYFFSLVTLLIASLVVYLLASLLDPGYLPRENVDSIVKNIQKSKSQRTELSMPSADADITTSTEPGFHSNYCKVCRHIKPMRVKHCYSCGRCVRRFDHHCPWLGNCVGERNHVYFLLFLALELALVTWGTYIAWGGLSFSDSGQVLVWLRNSLLILLSLILMFVSAVLVFFLFLYHCYLMVTGQTTWEQASRTNIPYLHNLKNINNPFNEGCLFNIKRFVCSLNFINWEEVYHNRTDNLIV